MKKHLFLLAILASSILAACSSKALDEAKTNNGDDGMVVTFNQTNDGPQDASSDVTIDPEDMFNISYGYASGLNYSATGSVDMTRWGVYVACSSKYRLLAVDGILKNYDEEDFSEIYFSQVAVPVNWETHKYNDHPDHLHFDKILRTSVVDFNYIAHYCTEPYYQTFRIYFVDKADKLYCKELTWEEVNANNGLEFPLCDI